MIALTLLFWGAFIFFVVLAFFQDRELRKLRSHVHLLKRANSLLRDQLMRAVKNQPMMFTKTPNLPRV